MIVDNVLYVQDANSHYHPAAANTQGELKVDLIPNAELGKIVDFAGQGQNDISDDGDTSKLQVFSYGRDRAGNKMRAMDIDATGKLNVNVVSSTGGGDLTARTNITDTATSKNLKCDSNGNLQVGIAENPTVHVRGNDGDNGAGANRMIKCSAKGELITKPDLDAYAGAVNNTNTIGDGSTQLRVVPLGYDRDNGKAVSLLIESDGTLGGIKDIKAQLIGTSTTSGVATILEDSYFNAQQTTQTLSCAIKTLVGTTTYNLKKYSKVSVIIKEKDNDTGSSPHGMAILEWSDNDDVFFSHVAESSFSKRFSADGTTSLGYWWSSGATDVLAKYLRVKVYNTSGVVSHTFDVDVNFMH